MMQTHRDPLVVRLCLAVVRTFAVLVPAVAAWGVIAYSGIARAAST